MSTGKLMSERARKLAVKWFAIVWPGLEPDSDIIKLLGDGFEDAMRCALQARTSADPMLVEARAIIRRLAESWGPYYRCAYCASQVPGKHKAVLSRPCILGDWLTRYDATHGGTPTEPEKASGTLPSTNQRVSAPRFPCCGCCDHDDDYVHAAACISCHFPTASAGGRDGVRSQEILPVGTPTSNAGTAGGEGNRG